MALDVGKVEKPCPRALLFHIIRAWHPIGIKKTPCPLIIFICSFRVDPAPLKTTSRSWNATNSFKIAHVMHLDSMHHSASCHGAIRRIFLKIIWPLFIIEPQVWNITNSLRTLCNNNTYSKLSWWQHCMWVHTQKQHWHKIFSAMRGSEEGFLLIILKSVKDLYLDLVVF